MSHIFNEFIYYDPDFKGEHGDFTDDSVFTPGERFDFLRDYANYLKRSFDLPQKSQKAVEMSKVRENLKFFGDDGGWFCEAEAYLADMPRQYDNWRLYTKKAVVNGSSLLLKSANLPPNPSALYELSGDIRPREIDLSFVMGSEYAAVINGVVRETTTARTIELRRGIEDIVKIAFYSNGECYVRYYEKPYHPKFFKIGEYAFDNENSLKIIFGESTFEVILNEDRLSDIPYSSAKIPDTLFFCSGMFHFGDWEITPKCIDYGTFKVTEFFSEASAHSKKLQSIGKITLPHAVGGAENRDKMLIIKKEFDLPETQNAELCFDSLDPGGEVYIDGEQVYYTDGFDSFTVDVSALSKNQTHLLEVRVFPRAPEVLFGWHRQQDPYNGWFCGEIALKCYDDVRLDNLQIITEKIEGNKAVVRFCGRASGKCNIKITAEPLYCKKAEELNLTEFYANGDFEILETFDIKPWSPETPNLYNICFTAFCDNKTVFSECVETGFRTVEQKNGEIWLNGERVDLNGALLMQFLPTYTETSQAHICPTNEQIMWQEMMLKATGGNTLRLHILGYGTNDARYARYADRLGILLIWTTRYIDSIEGVQWQNKWRARDAYLKQVSERLNHPSIIMWEGSNEFRPNLMQIDSAYEEFVSAIKSVDVSRIICPISHLYYAADLYPARNCAYYCNCGNADHNGNPAVAPKDWSDPLVVRSAHTYSLLCGYGSGWDKMREQSWREQKNLLESRKHAYIVSEFAVIGRQDPTTDEAKKEYFNPYSYEFPDEKPLGIDFTQDDWLESQAYQALCVHNCIKRMRLLDVDGMLWCCLMGGANDGGYLKPVIDNYGYAKLGLYAMNSAFQKVCVFTNDVNIKKGEFTFTPVLFGEAGKRYNVIVEITDKEGRVLESNIYSNILCENRKTELPLYISKITESGVYGIRFHIK